jgi:hypothetical protein
MRLSAIGIFHSSSNQAKKQHLGSVLAFQTAEALNVAEAPIN